MPQANWQLRQGQMSDTNNGQPWYDRVEHEDSIHAKNVIAWGWNGSGYEKLPATSNKATNAYSIQAISDDGTYKYFFFEDASANWYILRKTLTTSVFLYTKGTGGYASVYVSSTAGPSGSPTWADYGATF